MSNFNRRPTVINTGFCNNTPDQIGGFGVWTDGGGNSLLYCAPPIPVPPACPADITGSGGLPDGTVNIVDLLELLSSWWVCP